MKLLSRDFTFREKVCIGIFSLILLILLYFYVIDQPVRSGIREAESNAEVLQTELAGVEGKISELEAMEEELQAMQEDDAIGRMESYNNSKQEVAFINDTLAASSDYSFSFDEVTREGNLIRRPLVLQYTASDYQTAVNIVEKLEKCPYRCVIGEVRCETEDDGTASVSLTATFYETLVGGIEDAGLPEDSAAEAQVTETTDDDYDY